MMNNQLLMAIGNNNDKSNNNKKNNKLLFCSTNNNVRSSKMYLMLVVGIVYLSSVVVEGFQQPGWLWNHHHHQKIINKNPFLLQQQKQNQKQRQYYKHQSRIIQTSSSLTALQVAKSGARLIETEEEFADFVLAEDSPRPVLVFFSAPWCGPCRLTNPVVKETMKQFNDSIDVVEICTDDLAEVASECGVVSIPTIQFYYSNQLLDTIVGCVAKSVLANAVDKVLDDIKVLKKSKDMKQQELLVQQQQNEEEEKLDENK